MIAIFFKNIFFISVLFCFCLCVRHFFWVDRCFSFPYLNYIIFLMYAIWYLHLLQQKSDELKSENSHSVEPWDVHHHLPDRAFMSNSHFRNQNDGPRNIDNTLRHTLSNNVVQNDIDSTIQTHRESRRESDNVNGTLRVLGSGQASSDPSGFSQFSLPSASSFSPSRYIRRYYFP